MILVTGKIGVGKTELLENITSYPVYYMDKIIKEKMYVRGHLLFDEIIATFGNEMVFQNKIDTKKLGLTVLNSEKQISILNSLVQKHFKNFFNSLPKKSIVEFGAYLTQEEVYKPFFEKVIQILRSLFSE